MDDRDGIEEGRWTGLCEVIRMTWPIVLGSMSFGVMEFVDRAMVSHIGKDQMGTAALAAVGSASLWSYTLSTFFIGLVTCVSTFAAQSFGRGEKVDCARYAWQGIYLSFGAGMLCVVLWPLAPVAFGSMGHSEGVTALEIEYFRIRLFGYIPLVWASALVVFFQAVNRSKIPMCVAVVANVSNVFLNYGFIFGEWGFPELGFWGAALSTSISQFFQALMLQWFFLRRDFREEYGTHTGWRFDLRRTRELIRIGIPSGCTMFFDIATWGIFVSYIVGYFGDVSLAASNVAVSFMMLSFLPAVAMNQGISAIVGQCVGRGDPGRAKARTYTALKIAWVYMGGMSLLFGVFGGLLIELVFGVTPEVVQLGHRFLIMAAIFQAFDAVMIVSAGALRGAGDTRWVMWTTMFFAWVVFLPLALWFSFGLKGEATGAWMAATIYIISLSVVMFLRFRSEKWREINIFSELNKG